MKNTLKPLVTNCKHSPDWAFNDIETDKTNINTLGFTCIENIFSSKLLSELRLEAFDKKKDAKIVRSESKCQYQAHLAGLGKLGTAILTKQRMLKLLDNIFGVPLKLEKDASCYTYYHPGDFLDPHLDDKELCKVTVILYLDVIHSDKRINKTGLELHILGKSSSDEDNPKVILPTKTGSLIIGLGSVYWHKRPTLQNGEFITALTACYS